MASAALGPLVWQVRSEAADRVELTFPWVDDLANPDGVLHGGAIAASLEEALVRLARISLGDAVDMGGGRGGGGTASTRRAEVLERRISFERPGRGTAFSARAWPLRQGRHTAFLEAVLMDDRGEVCAKAEAVASRVPVGDDGPGPAGLDLARPAAFWGSRTLRGEILARANPYRDRVGVRLAMPDTGRSLFWLAPDGQHRTGPGPVHAGVLLTLLDLGMGHALLAGVPTVTRPITLSLEATTPVPCHAPWLLGHGTLRGGFGTASATGLYDVEAEILDGEGRTQARARAVFQGR